MKVELKLVGGMKIEGDNGRGHQIYFDTSVEHGGDNSAASPMEVMLQAMAACSFMDVVSILRKKRRTVDAMQIHVQGERADTHPKVFTKVHLIYDLISPDAEMKDLERSIELSQTQYCGASAMFQRSGCEVTWEAKINRN